MAVNWLLAKFHISSRQKNNKMFVFAATIRTALIQLQALKNGQMVDFP
jgi:hypothetical protein